MRHTAAAFNVELATSLGTHVFLEIVETSSKGKSIPFPSSPDIHVYGHSHINRNVRIDGIRYINNALGYPQESAIAARRLIETVDDA